MADSKAFEILPDALNLQPSVYNVQLLEYMMVCYRTPPSYYLPVPPPEFCKHQIDQDVLVKALQNSYMNLIYMLADDSSTERERVLVDSHAALVCLKKWLPAVAPEQIVKMHKPEQMNHLDYVFMLRDCMGKYSYNDDYCFFTNPEDMQKFQDYLAELNTVNSNCSEQK